MQCAKAGPKEGEWPDYFEKAKAKQAAKYHLNSIGYFFFRGIICW